MFVVRGTFENVRKKKSLALKLGQDSFGASPWYFDLQSLQKGRGFTEKSVFHTIQIRAGTRWRLRAQENSLHMNGAMARRLLKPSKPTRKMVGRTLPAASIAHDSLDCGMWVAH
jgi:hypothetical protein